MSSEGFGGLGLSSSSSMQPEVLSRSDCRHKLQTDVLTEHVGSDARRRYFACPVRKFDDCDFFQCIDWPTPRNFCLTRCHLRLKAEQQKYEALLQRKALVEEKVVGNIFFRPWTTTHNPPLRDNPRLSTKSSSQIMGTKRLLVKVNPLEMRV